MIDGLILLRWFIWKLLEVKNYHTVQICFVHYGWISLAGIFGYNISWYTLKLNVANTQGSGRGPTSFVYCTQLYPIFTQEADSKTSTHDLSIITITLLLRQDSHLISFSIKVQNKLCSQNWYISWSVDYCSF